MRSVCSSWPPVMSTTEASVRYGSGRGVFGSSAAAVLVARPYAATSPGCAEPSAILRSRASHSSYSRWISWSKAILKDWLGLRRAYSQRSSGASMISSASAGVGTPPFEEDILAMPLMPTKAYIGPIGCRPSKTSRTIWPPTTYEEPGEEWSTPLGSKTTPSYAQRIGQSTFQTSLPRSCSRSSTVSSCPQTQV